MGLKKRKKKQLAPINILCESSEEELLLIYTLVLQTEALRALILDLSDSEPRQLLDLIYLFQLVITRRRHGRLGYCRISCWFMPFQNKTLPSLWSFYTLLERSLCSNRK